MADIYKHLVNNNIMEAATRAAESSIDAHGYKVPAQEAYEFIAPDYGVMLPAAMPAAFARFYARA